MIITVDCGTTNMRCRLFDGTRLVDEERRRAGVRNTAFSGTNEFLRISLRECVAALLERNALSTSDVEAVVSSGTLASDVGIYTIPHAIAPVGAEESARAARLVTLPEITEIPILFIPGVKTRPAGGEELMKQIELFDSMSGEECETYGIMELLGIKGDFSITLPGSYNKTMEVDGEGRIVSMRTGMCGEFIAAVSEHTLLKHSLHIPPIKTIDGEKLLLGFDYCRIHGASPSLIKGRMLRVHMGWDDNAAGNFFVGAALYDDIMATIEAYKEGCPLVVGGGDPLRTVFRILLTHAGVLDSDLVCLDDDTARIAPSIGAMKVYRRYLEINK